MNPRWNESRLRMHDGNVLNKKKEWSRPCFLRMCNMYIHKLKDCVYYDQKRWLPTMGGPHLKKKEKKSIESVQDYCLTLDLSSFFGNLIDLENQVTGCSLMLIIILLQSLKTLSVTSMTYLESDPFVKSWMFNPDGQHQTSQEHKVCGFHVVHCNIILKEQNQLWLNFFRIGNCAVLKDI